MVNYFNRDIVEKPFQISPLSFDNRHTQKPSAQAKDHLPPVAA